MMARCAAHVPSLEARPSPPLATQPSLIPPCLPLDSPSAPAPVPCHLQTTRASQAWCVTGWQGSRPRNNRYHYDFAAMAVDNGWRKLTGSVLDSKKVLSMTSECFLMEDGSVWCTLPPDSQQVADAPADRCNWNTDLEECSVTENKVVTLQQVIGLPSPAVSLGDDDLFKQGIATRATLAVRTGSRRTMGRARVWDDVVPTTAVVVRALPAPPHPHEGGIGYLLVQWTATHTHTSATNLCAPCRALPSQILDDGDVWSIDSARTPTRIAVSLPAKKLALGPSSCALLVDGSVEGYACGGTGAGDGEKWVGGEGSGRIGGQGSGGAEGDGSSSTPRPPFRLSTHSMHT